MSCIDIKQEFLSYVDVSFQHSPSWNSSTFLKKCNNSLSDILSLEGKMKQLQKKTRGSRIIQDRQQMGKMLLNVKESMKECEKNIKIVKSMNADLKSNSSEMVKKFKESVLLSLEIKLLQTGKKFKKIYSSHVQPTSQSQQSNMNKNNTPNLSKSHFIEQSQEELLEEVAVNEYKEIEKSIYRISEMYKEQVSMVQMQEYLVESIQSNIDETEINVDKGKKHLYEAHSREAKNRDTIKKVFIVLYILVFVYIVFLS